MSRPQDAIPKLSRGESVEVAQKDGESASGEALPEGWAEIELGDVMSIRNGYAFKSKEFQQEGVPLIRQSNLAGRTVDLESAMRLPQEYLDEYARFSLKQGDILIGMSGSIGKLCLYDKPEVGLQNQRTGKIDFLDDSDSLHGYLWFFLQTVQRRLEDKGKGIGVQNVSAGDIETLKLTLPPEAEQSRIVSAIESLQERSSRARVLLSEVGPLIGQLRQSVLRDAFSGKLTADWRARRSMGPRPVDSSKPNITNRHTHDPNETHEIEDGTQIHGPGAHATNETASELLLRIRTERRERWQSEQLAKYEAKGKQPPKNWQDKYKEPEPVDESDLPELPDGWCWAPLELIATHQSGFAFKSKHFSDEGIQVVKLGNLYQGRFDLTRDPAYLPEDHEDADAALIHGGDILVSQTGTRHKRDYGFFVLIPQGTKPLLLNQRVLAVRSIDPSLTEWIVFASRTEFYRDYFFSTETGGVNQGNVGVGGIMRGPIPVAPMAEMKEITARLEECNRATSFTAAEIASMESSLTQLDQSILSKAFRGELVPQDPRDEPASELLARIRNTREKLEAEKKAAKKKTRKKAKG
jgi:type I restriction enzyme S subunit